MRTLYPILPILAAACIVAAAVWLHRRPAAPAPGGPGLLLISGDTAGWITPCGCTVNQSGGLLRRGAYLRTLRNSSNVIYADVGGAPAGTSPYQRAKFEAIVKGELDMGVCAHNIGGAEAALGPAYLREMAARLKFPLISANAHDAQGRPFSPPLRIVRVNGQRVALIGVLSPRFSAPDILADDPRACILRALQSAAGSYDFSVVLAYLPEDELSQLAADLPEVDAVVGGPTGQAIAPRAAGPTLLAAATNKGKFLVQLEVPKATGRLIGKIVEMGPSFADDEMQRANLRQYLDFLSARDFSSAESGFAPAAASDAPADYRIAGSASCRACHPAESQSWSASGHARAWQTLEARGFQVDPFCQQCHTTGYGLPGGFDSVRASATLGEVGCESCHGPSLAHAQNPRTHTRFVAADQCIRCHDHENSPDFDFSMRWQRIRHGPRAATSSTMISPG